MPHVPDPSVAVDLDWRSRPGVPQERPPHPEPGAHLPIIPQRSAVKVFTHGRPGKAMPPVFGTAQPPSGLSGAIRAYAYKYPDHWMRHWTVLLLSDRVNVWEKRARILGTVLGPALGILSVGWGFSRLHRAGRRSAHPRAAVARARSAVRRKLRRGQEASAPAMV